MTMLYSFHDNLEITDTKSQFNVVSTAEQATISRKSELHLFKEKLRVPEFQKFILRPRLDLLLQKSLAQFGSTLILGRSGMGKTTLAADFSKKYENVAWFSIESADNNWEVFVRYFTKCFNEPLVDFEDFPKNDELNEISHFVESLLLRLSAVKNEKPRLIVLDNLHYVFDSEWFIPFLNTLIYSLPTNVHLLLLSRSQPPLPLWRLRSKQVLGVIDEKNLSFNQEETTNLLQQEGFSKTFAIEAYKKSFGRISKLKEISLND